MQIGPSLDAETSTLPTIDAAYVTWRLEEAGITLLTLPPSGWSTGLRSSALDIVRSAADSYGWTEGRLRPPIPSAAKITRMDVTLGWISLIPPDRYVLRRIVGARTLVHPVTERHLFPWRRLGALLAPTTRRCSGGTRTGSGSSSPRWLRRRGGLRVCDGPGGMPAEERDDPSGGVWPGGVAPWPPPKGIALGTLNQGWGERSQPTTAATKRSRSASEGGFSTTRSTPSAAARATIAGVGEPVISRTGILSPAARIRATSSSPVTSGMWWSRISPARAPCSGWARKSAADSKVVAG